MSFVRYFLAGSMFAASVGAAQAETLDIGAAVAETEFMAIFDQPFMNGAKMAIDEINAAGGIDGRIKINLSQEDTRSDPSQTMIITQRLLEDDIDVLFLSSGTAEAMTAGPLAQDAGILIFPAVSTNPALPGMIGPNFLGTLLADNQQAAMMAKYAHDTLGAETAWLLVSGDDPYTENSPKYFASMFEKLGGSVVGQANFTLFQAEFGSVISQLRDIQPEPDVIFTAAFEPDFPVFLKQLRAAGINSRVLGMDGIDSPTTYGLGDVANGVTMITARPASTTAQFAEFSEKYKAESGSDEGPNSYTSIGYGTVMMLADGVKATGSTDAAKLLEWFGGLENYQSLLNSYTYAGMDGFPSLDGYVVEIQDGSPTYKETIRLAPDEIPAPLN